MRHALSVTVGSGRGLSVRAGDGKGPGATLVAGPAGEGGGEGRWAAAGGQRPGSSYL